jgi:hypothetical protein
LEKEKALYLQNLNIPSVLVVVDTKTGKCYWKSPFEYQEKDKSLCYIFKPTDEISFGGFDRYVNNLRSLLKAIDGEEIISFHKLFLRLNEMTSYVYDFGTLMENDDEIDVKSFFDHVKRVRQLAGVAQSNIIPWDYWRIRSKSIVDDTPFCYEAFNELMAYLKPFYFEALQVLKERVVANDEFSSMSYYLEALTEFDKAPGHTTTVEFGIDDSVELEVNELIEAVLKYNNIKPAIDYKKKTT